MLTASVLQAASACADAAGGHRGARAGEGAQGAGPRHAHGVRVQSEPEGRRARPLRVLLAGRRGMHNARSAHTVTRARLLVLLCQLESGACSISHSDQTRKVFTCCHDEAAPKVTGLSLWPLHVTIETPCSCCKAQSIARLTAAWHQSGIARLHWWQEGCLSMWKPHHC